MLSLFFGFFFTLTYNIKKYPFTQSRRRDSVRFILRDRRRIGDDDHLTVIRGPVSIPIVGIFKNRVILANDCAGIFQGIGS
ncbi:hypothetical protein D4R75_10130 [bacterium]|nr:MAG: hypothetical protein D4R75_10130 [bacterium]